MGREIRIDGRLLVTILQASQMAGVSRRTIYHWMEGNKVDAIRLAGGQVRIYADSLFRSKDGSAINF